MFNLEYFQFFEHSALFHKINNLKNNFLFTTQNIFFKCVSLCLLLHNIIIEKIFIHQNHTRFPVVLSLLTEYLGCLTTQKTERLYMPGLHFHTGLYMPIVLRTQLFIIFSVVSLQLFLLYKP